MPSRIWIAGCALVASLASPLVRVEAQPARQTSASSSQQTMHIQSSACESRVNPDGIDVTSPALSWMVASPTRGDGQTAYQILVASSLALLNQNKGALWNSGK